MLTDTQISSFLIPKKVWSEGYPGREDLPPLAIPARDALDIERRAQKNVNIRNEKRRYTLCCERIQGIVRELAQEPDILHKPVVWPAHHQSNESLPSARAYLALVDALVPFGRQIGRQRNLNVRFASVFFPPYDVQMHLNIFKAIYGGAALDQLFANAARNGSLPDSPFEVTKEQCRAALDQRYELLKTAALEECGLVDVVELG